MNQIREANDDYEKATREKSDANYRLRDAKLKIAAMNKKRMLLEREIEEYERNYVSTKNYCEYKLKIYAANRNMERKEELTAGALADLESHLYQAKNMLANNTVKFNSIFSEYKDRRRRLAEMQKRKQESSGSNVNMGNDLREMQLRIEELQSRHVFRQQKMAAMEEEVERIGEVIEDAEMRTALAEQYHISLETHRETILEELGNMKTKRYDALDKTEEIKRLRKELMKQYNVSHPSQLIAKR